MTPEDRAKRAAEVLWESDNASKWIGMELVEIGVGRAVMSLVIAAHHANGHGIGHGGVTFALADSAFAFACNSYNRNTVAQVNQITFVKATHVGDRLMAEAREVSLAGRSGIYDVTVKNQNDEVVAEFRGVSRMIQGQLFEEVAS